MKFHHPPLLCLYLALNCIRQTLPSKHIQVNSINSNIKFNNNFTSLKSSGSIVYVNEKYLQGTVWAESSQAIIGPFDTYANITARNISSEINLSNYTLIQASSDFLKLYVTSNRTADDGNSVFTQIFEGSTNFSFIDTSDGGNRLMLQAINANRVVTDGYTQQLSTIKQYTLTVEKDRVLFDADHSQYDAIVQIDGGIILIDNEKARLEINENRTVVKIYGSNDVMTFTSSEPYKIYFDSDSIKVSHEEEEIVVNHNGEVLSAHVETPSRLILNLSFLKMQNFKSIFTNDGGYITMDRSQSMGEDDVAMSAASLTVQIDSKGNVTMDVSRSSINISSPIEKISVNSKHSHPQSSTEQPHIIINTNLTCVDMEHQVSSAPELWEFQKPTNLLNYTYEEEVTVAPFPFPPPFNISPTTEVYPPSVTSLPIGDDTISPETNLPNMETSTSPTDYSQSNIRDKPLFYLPYNNGEIWEGRICLFDSHTNSVEQIAKFTDYLWPWGVATTEDKIFAISFYDKSSEIFDLNTRQITKGPDPPEWRKYASVTYFKDKLYYLGGWDPKTNERTNRIDVLIDGTWQTGPAFSLPISWVQAITCDEILYVIDGWGSKKIYRLSDDELEWIEVGEIPETRLSFGVTPLNGKIYITGGENFDSVFKSCLCFDPSVPVDNRISRIADMNYARHQHSLVVANGKLYAIGGYQEYHMANFCNSIEEYDPQTNEWHEVGKLT